MPKFLFVYHKGKMQPPADPADAMARWGKWIADHKANMADPGDPVGKSLTVHADRVDDHGGANPAFGYSIIEASNMDEATAIAKACPMVVDGGNVEVAEIHHIEM